MDPFALSIVIAAKDPPAALFELCLASFAALTHAPRLQLVIVQSGSLPPIPPATAARFADIKVVEVAPEGVYAAYNAGVQVAQATYVLFFGIDDIALPGMDAVIELLGTASPRYHLFGAACYMQSVGVSQPSNWRASLVFRNWCHQGIFYLREHLREHRYQTEYRAQADHKLNIDIVSDRRLRFGVSSELVAYFSAGGVSSMRPDLKFRQDFPAIVSRAYGRPYGWLVKLKQRLIDAVLGDPETRFKARTRR